MRAVPTQETKEQEQRFRRSRRVRGGSVCRPVRCSASRWMRVLSGGPPTASQYPFEADRADGRRGSPCFLRVPLRRAGRNTPRGPPSSLRQALRHAQGSATQGTVRVTAWVTPLCRAGQLAHLVELPAGAERYHHVVGPEDGIRRRNGDHVPCGSPSSQVRESA